MCKCNPKIRTPYCGKRECIWPDEIEIVQVEIYDGTMESLEKLAIAHDLERKHYHFNIFTKHLTIWETGMIFSPGNHYFVKSKDSELTPTSRTS